MRYICTAVVAMLALVGTSFAATINVPGDQPTIAAAISASVNGDVINIAAGTYNEYGLSTNGKAVTIQGTVNGDSSLATTIDAQQGSNVFFINSGEGDGTVLKNLLITGGAGNSAGGGIFCSQSSPIITGCTISDNASGGGGGGIYCSQSNPTITSCMISSNTANSSGGGIWCINDSIPTITGCLITNNTAASGGGIYCDSTSTPTISNSQICGNAIGQITGGYADAGGNTVAHECPPPQQAACCIENTCTVLTQYNCEWQGGTWHSTIDTCAATNICNAEAACCTGTTCTVTTAYDCGTLGGTWHQSIATCADCNVCNNMDGVCCSNGICISNAHLSECETYGGVFIPCGDCTTADCSSTSPVSTINVPGDYSSVADAITAASDGDVIQIGAGTFSEGNINTMGKAITIQGSVNSDGSLASTIDTQQETSSVIRIDNDEGPDTVIQNLILTGGAPNRGGGIFCGVGTSPTITGCLITGNVAASFGGGIQCSHSGATITKCIIKNNSAPSGGGISCKGSPSPSIAYCTIMRNTADTGSGVYSDNSDPVMTGSTICQNTSSSSQVSGTWTDGGSNDICCPGDTNGDGVIDIEDLLNMLGNWGPCP
jgi:predicted outer membrane repeat protein